MSFSHRGSDEIIGKHNGDRIRRPVCRAAPGTILGLSLRAKGAMHQVGDVGRKYARPLPQAVLTRAL
jgi:hypothetical protein